VDSAISISLVEDSTMRLSLGQYPIPGDACNRPQFRTPDAAGNIRHMLAPWSRGRLINSYLDNHGPAIGKSNALKRLRAACAVCTVLPNPWQHRLPFSINGSSLSRPWERIGMHLRRHVMVTEMKLSQVSSRLWPACEIGKLRRLTTSRAGYLRQ
jgi:hypothetical protein